MNGMGSDHPSELLAAYLDDELPIEDRDRVDHHLAECPSCRAELDALHLLAAAVAAEPVPEPAEDLVVRIGAHVDRSIVTPLPARRRWIVPVSVAATIGAVGLLVAFQWRQGTLTPSSGPPPAPYAPAPVPAEKQSSSARENRTEALQPRPSAEPQAERDARLKSLGYVGGSPPAENRPQEPTSPSNAATGPEEPKLKKVSTLAATPAPPPPAPPASAARAVAPADEMARAKDEALGQIDRDLDQKRTGPAVVSVPVSTASREPAQEVLAGAPGAPDKVAEGRFYQNVLHPQGRADATACGDSWIDAGRLAEWAVPDAGAAARDLEALARGLGGRGSEQRAADGVTYVIDVPSGRYDELARGLRGKGITGLETASAPASTAPCVRQRVRIVEKR